MSTENKGTTSRMTKQEFIDKWAIYPYYVEQLSSDLDAVIAVSGGN